MAAIPIPGVNTPTYQTWGAAVATRINLPKACQVIKPSANAASVAPGVFTVMTWNAFVYGSTAGIFVNGDAFQIPAGEAGLWQVSIGTGWAAGTANTLRYAGLLINGGVADPAHEVATSAAGSDGSFLSATWDMQFAAGDLLQVRVLHRSAGNITVNGRWSIRKVSETPT